MRAKASEEMLSTLPSKRIDWSSFGVEKRAVPYPLIAERVHSSVNEKDKSELLNASLRPLTGISSSKGILEYQTLIAFVCIFSFLFSLLNTFCHL